MGGESSLIRVMALRALAYCERLFYLEEVEEIRVADHAVYAGRALHEELRQVEEEAEGWSSHELSSDRLGLTGKVDCLRRRDGSVIPYEHKRGRPRRDANVAAAWPGDALQVSGYGMLLEEELKRPVPEGRIRYHAENVTVRVPLDEASRRSVREAVERARVLRASEKRPPVAENDRLCIRCSLAPVCLPEEERLAADPTWEPIRLFPPDPERKSIHVQTPGARVSRAGDTLKIRGEGGDQAFPVREVGCVVLYGYAQITTQAVHFCHRHDIQIHWISPGGRYICGTSSSGRVQQRIRQYRALSEIGLCLRLSRRLAMNRIENTLRYLLRATRKQDRNTLGVEASIGTMRSMLKAAALAESLDSLRGHEGMAARAWYEALPELLSDKVPEKLLPSGRTRRPPRDRFNALLSFGYSLLYQSVMQVILAVGLEPALGFYHQPRSAAHPLVLDLMEMFRLSLWEVPLIGSVNRLHWRPGDDFDDTKGRVWLSSAGRRKAITLFENRLLDKWRHPVIGYSLSYRRLIELEIRLLEKEWTGRAGLFARMRLR